MAVTYIADGTAVPITTGGDIAPPLPTGWMTDDILIALVAAVDNVVCTMPAGWTLLNATNNGVSSRVSVFWKRAVSTETSPVTITHTAGGAINASIGAWRGATGPGTTNSPFGVVGTPLANASSTTVTANAITPSKGAHVVFLTGTSANGLATNVNAYNVTNPTLTARFFNGAGNCGGIASGSEDSSTGTATTVNTATLNRAALSVGQMVSISALANPPVDLMHRRQMPTLVAQ